MILHSAVAYDKSSSIAAPMLINSTVCRKPSSLRCMNVSLLDLGACLDSKAAEAMD
jgi:hypothetical protein